jgi:hypothetical protein
VAYGVWQVERRNADVERINRELHDTADTFGSKKKKHQLNEQDLTQHVEVRSLPLHPRAGCSHRRHPFCLSSPLAVSSCPGQVMNRHDAVFWFGDLNYRVQPLPEPEESETGRSMVGWAERESSRWRLPQRWPSLSTHTQLHVFPHGRRGWGVGAIQVLSAIKNRQWDDLLGFDQLREQQRKKVQAGAG